MRRPFGMVNAATKITPKPVAERLGREEWLARALEVVARAGGIMPIDLLVKKLGVTKGSFYWHFKDRKDFVHSLLDYWTRVYTKNVGRDVSRVEGDAGTRLLALMEVIHKNDWSRHDLALRAWADREPEVAEALGKVYRFRLDYVRSLFSEMGFEGRDLEMRARTFVIFHSMESSFLIKESEKEEAELLKIRYRMFTAPLDQP